MLGNALCEALNGIRQNNSTVHVEKDNLFWLTLTENDAQLTFKAPC